MYDQHPTPLDFYRFHLFETLIRYFLGIRMKEGFNINKGMSLETEE